MHLVEDKDLTKEEKQYLENLFWKYQQEIEEKIHQKMVDEFHLLSRYKGELARKFTELNGFHGTLLGCMKEMIDKQDALFQIHSDLINLILRTNPQLIKEFEVVQ
jgi:hypothetical protein